MPPGLHQLQTIANNSTQVTQLRRTQQAANAYTQPQTSAETVIQREVDLTEDTVTTENEAYFVKQDDTEVLYSNVTAPPPLPQKLYYKEEERSTERQRLYKWLPNAQFLTKDDERGIIDHGGNVSGITNFDDIDDYLQFPVPGDHCLELPYIGTLGHNDCSGWARTLRTMISAEGVDNSALHPDDEMAIGDRMTHIFDSDEPMHCSVHSATVVATDGSSLVTLEAHASKNLLAPEFHIREGKAGFLADNNQTRNLGNQLTIDRANGKAGSMHDLQNRREEYERADFSLKYSAIRDTAVMTQLQLDMLNAIDVLAGQNWAPYTVGCPSTPQGVGVIGNFAGVHDPDDPQEIHRRLLAVIAQAGADHDRFSPFRHDVTARFYDLIRNIDKDDPDSLRDTRDAIVALEGLF